MTFRVKAVASGRKSIIIGESKIVSIKDFDAKVQCYSVHLFYRKYLIAQFLIVKNVIT